MACPKCGYERQPNQAECPQCGIVYEKYFAFAAKKKAEGDPYNNLLYGFRNHGG